MGIRTSYIIVIAAFVASATIASAEVSDSPRALRLFFEPAGGGDANDGAPAEIREDENLLSVRVTDSDVWEAAYGVYLERMQIQNHAKEYVIVSTLSGFKELLLIGWDIVRVPGSWGWKPSSSLIGSMKEHAEDPMHDRTASAWMVSLRDNYIGSVRDKLKSDIPEIKFEGLVDIVLPLLPVVTVGVSRLARIGEAGNVASVPARAIVAAGETEMVVAQIAPAGHLGGPINWMARRPRISRTRPFREEAPYLRPNPMVFSSIERAFAACEELLARAPLTREVVSSLKEQMVLIKRGMSAKGNPRYERIARIVRAFDVEDMAGNILVEIRGGKAASWVVESYRREFTHLKIRVTGGRIPDEMIPNFQKLKTIMEGKQTAKIGQ